VHVYSGIREAAAAAEDAVEVGLWLGVLADMIRFVRSAVDVTQYRSHSHLIGARHDGRWLGRGKEEEMMMNIRLKLKVLHRHTFYLQ
jgi:hypothetical protein